VVLRLSYRRILRRPEASRSSLASVGSTRARTGRSGASKLANAASRIGGGSLVRPQATRSDLDVVPCKLHLSGRELDEVTPGRCQDRVASGRTLSARRLHRYQHSAARRERRRLLQQARHVRAVDQGGQGGDQMDPAVMPFLRRQRGSPSASRARLQSRQLPAHAGDAGADQGLVDDDAARKADQDRREGRRSRALRLVPDGRGCSTAQRLRRHLAHDHGTSAASNHVDGVVSSVVTRLNETTGKVCLYDGKFRISPALQPERNSGRWSKAAGVVIGLSKFASWDKLWLVLASIWRMSVYESTAAWQA
jgi:hypothetical protein